MQIEFISTEKTEKENIFWENRNKVRSIKRDLDLILPQKGEETYDQGKSKTIVKFAQREWFNLRDRLERFIKKKGLVSPKQLTCVLTQWGCGGAFKPEENLIVVRLKRDTDFDRFDKVLTHEVLHILTYKQNQSYQGREQEVETLIEEFEKLSNKKLDKGGKIKLQVNPERDQRSYGAIAL